LSTEVLYIGLGDQFDDIYPNRSHWTCIQAGWEEVADFALDWAAEHARAPNVLPLKAA
jgi:hypothetical protein